MGLFTGLSCLRSLLRQGLPSTCLTLVDMTHASTATTSLLDQHPPLAHDAAGNPLKLQDGTAGFGLARETTGRPRRLPGPDKKQPLRLPLHATPEDIVELCGPGVYRVYALDAFGAQLSEDHLSRWELTASSFREPRNASVDSTLASRFERGAMSAPTSDLRFALEAITQMMRTNTDALRLVAESQVDLAKTIATVKGLPRNATMYQLPTVVPADTSEESDEEDEEDEEDAPTEARPSNYVDLLMPFTQALAPKVAEMFPGMVAGINDMAFNTGAKLAGRTKTQPSESTDLASRPFEVREIVDLRYAHKKGAAKRAAVAEQSATAAQQPNTAADSLRTRVMSDQQLVKQVLAIKRELAADEIEFLMSTVKQWEEGDQQQFLEHIKTLPVAGAVTYCRELIETIRSHKVPTEAPASVEA